MGWQVLVIFLARLLIMSSTWQHEPLLAEGRVLPFSKKQLTSISRGTTDSPLLLRINMCITAGVQSIQLITLFFRSILHLNWLKHRVQAPSIAGTDLEYKLKFVTSPFLPDLHKVPRYGKPCWLRGNLSPKGIDKSSGRFEGLLYVLEFRHLLLCNAPTGVTILTGDFIMDKEFGLKFCFWSRK